MAILKHIASKNANYTDIMDYLLFQHDEITGKEIKDEKGRRLLREEYYMNGINCEPMLFDTECERLNEQYHKNQKYSEIKCHHYIISFDPKDNEEPGLTGEKAQALGLEYAKKNFPGHQALVVTHTDGHNGTGNIHVHIIINSLRKLDVERQAFMDRPCDSRAGYKHHLTKDYLHYLRQALMDMCLHEGLHQVDLFSPSRKNITREEYYARLHGQRELDKRNAEIEAAGLKPRQTKFQTEKQYLRDAITDVASSAKSLEEFTSILHEKYKITVTDKRGRFSYLHPDRTKNITERALGADYSRAYILQLIEENQKRIERTEAIVEPPEQTTDIQNVPTGIPEEYAIFLIRSELRLVVDLQNCVKAQQSQAYEQKVKISNLQQMANTVAYVQEHGYDTRENLQSEYDDISEKLSVARRSLKDTEGDLKDLGEQIHYTGQYFATKKIYIQMLRSKNKKSFRQEHSDDIAKYEEALKYLKAKHPDGKIPSLKSLYSERAQLQIQKSARTDTYEYFKEYHKELRTVCKNVDSILGHILRFPASHRHVVHGFSSFGCRELGLGTHLTGLATKGIEVFTCSTRNSSYLTHSGVKVSCCLYCGDTNTTNYSGDAHHLFTSASDGIANGLHLLTGHIYFGKRSACSGSFLLQAS